MASGTQLDPVIKVFRHERAVKLRPGPNDKVALSRAERITGSCIATAVQ